MAISESGERLRQKIHEAIEDGKISHEEYDQIISIVSEDGHIDAQEQSLLRELQDMIESKMVKFSKE
jgi:hypothetical protein